MALFRIFFIDLIAYVPENNGKEIRVLLPATPHSDAHLPYFLFRRRNYLAGEEGIPSNGLNAWQLGGEELFIPNTNQPKLDIGLKPGENEDLPKINDSRFHWVTPLGKLHSKNGKGRVKPIALGQNGGNLVAARMKLDHGKLKAFHFCKDQKEDKIYTYRFGLNGKFSRFKNRAMVNIVCWEREVPEIGIEVKSNHFTSGLKREVTLIPKEGVINTALVNLGMAPTGGQTTTDHFKYFYNLVGDWGKNESQYIPERTNDTHFQDSRIVNKKWPEIISMIRDEDGGDPTIDLEGCPQAILEP